MFLFKVDDALVMQIMKTDKPDEMKTPRLLADVGGTNARFGLELSPGHVLAISVLPCNAHATLTDAMRAYLAEPAALAAGASRVRVAAVAIANPVDGDSVRMTNHDWQFSIEAVRRELGLESLLVVNDFKALARSLPYLEASQKQQVGGAAPRAGAVMGLLGPGTGLGVSGLIPCGRQWTALDSEGGHVTFAPSNEREIDILRFAWRQYPHVSAERLISGVGLNLIYQALAERAGARVEALSAPEIFRRALAQECSICDETVESFCEMLGTIAGNLAVTLGARGGIYIGGGIIPRLGQRFSQSGFRPRFEHKGRFAQFLAKIPVYVITAEYPAFIGLSALLADQD